jgi:Tol biopolymer transport system component
MASFHKKTFALIVLVLVLAACTPTSRTVNTTEIIDLTPVVPSVLPPTSTSPYPEVPTLPTTIYPVPNESLIPPTAVTPSEVAYTIVFGSNRDSDYMNIYTINTVSKQVTRLTSNDSNTVPGPFSPDGMKLLFTGFGLTNSFVGVMNADGSDPVNLSGRPTVDEGFPAWSPDGTQIAFTSRKDGNNEIYIMNADGTEIKRITNNPTDDFNPAWSPDGKTIAFVSDRDNPTGFNNLYLMDTDGTNIRRLTTNGKESDYEPAWSPDGTRIAFRADINGDGDIYLINPDGTSRVNLTNNTAADWAPAWSPEGNLIAFQTNRDGNFEIYLMNADGSNPTNLTQNPAEDQLPYWKPTTNAIQ